jgi:two-component system response regulator YesN
LYRLLIADDEQIVLDSLKFIVEKNFPDIKICAMVKTGREAIEKAETEKPDIIIIDIKMPGINGIDAITEIKKRYDLAKFIIFSAYDKFDFAKEALKLNVVDYILKPAGKKKIINIIEKVLNLINKERKLRKKELDLKEKIEKMEPVLETGLIYNLFFDNDSKELNSYIKLLNLDINSGFVLSLEFNKEEKSILESSSIVNSLYNRLREIIKKFDDIIIGPVMLNKIILVMPLDNHDDDYINRLEVLNFSNYLKEEFNKISNLEIHIGIGSYYVGIKQLKASYENSIKAVKNSYEKEIIYIEDINKKQNFNNYDLNKTEKTILDKIQKGNLEEAIRMYDDFFEKIISEYNFEIFEVKIRIMEFIILLNRFYLDNENNNKKYIDEIFQMNDLNKMRMWIRQKIWETGINIKKIKEKQLSGVIKKSLEFIEENFNCDLSLEEVANYVSISPHYFSKLFKEETGKNFVEYVTFLKINKAKTLLEEGVLNIKQISYEIGYKDPNYFSRLFKKSIGVSPSEYKDL